MHGYLSAVIETLRNRTVRRGRRPQIARGLAFLFVSSCSASQDTSIASFHIKTRVLNDPSFNTFIIIVNNIRALQVF